MTTPVPRLPLCLIIGIPVLGPEQGAAQDQTSAAIVSVPENDRAFGRRLEELFKINAPDWSEGFELALDMGESAAPPLAHKLTVERNQELRLLWIAAYGLAARSPHKQYARLKLKGAERSLAMFVLAIGPTQADGEAWVRKVLDGASDTTAAIATCLALARFENRTQGVTRRLLASQDPGELGAALYSDPSLSPEEISRHLAPMRARNERVDLVWRGYYLAAARTAADRKVLPARQAAALKAITSPDLQVRKAAALLLARSAPGQPLPQEIIAGLDDETAVILGLAPALRAQLLDAGRISAEPSPTQSRDEIRRRQVVLFACSAPVRTLNKAVMSWPKTSADLMDEVCLALAFRLSTSELDRKALAGALGHLGRVDGTLSEAGIWLRLAQHLDVPAKEIRSRAGSLPKPLQLALRGAMPDAVLARAVESLLWRRGSHPGLSALELQREFVFDLLLAHAAAGGQRQPYVPKGVLATGNDFLVVMNRLFQFIRTREPWALREHRLSL